MVYFISVRGLSSAYESSSNITLYSICFQLWVVMTQTIKMKSKRRLGKAAESGMVDRKSCWQKHHEKFMQQVHLTEWESSHWGVEQKNPVFTAGNDSRIIPEAYQSSSLQPNEIYWICRESLINIYISIWFNWSDVLCVMTSMSNEKQRHRCLDEIWECGWINDDSGKEK